MKPILVTSSGKVGDAIYNLATVRRIREKHPKNPLVFGVPEPYSSMLPIALSQPYVTAVAACPDPGMVSNSDMCRWDVPPPRGWSREDFKEHLQIGFRSNPMDQPRHVNVLAAAPLGIDPQLERPWLQKSVSFVIPGRISICLHDSMGRYAQPWFGPIVGRLPDLLLRGGWKEILLVGGPPSEGIHTPFAARLRGAGLHVLQECCSLFCSYLCLQTSEALLTQDTAIHGIGMGLGMRMLRLRRGALPLAVPKAPCTDLAFVDPISVALEKAETFLKRQSGKPSRDPSPDGSPLVEAGAPSR